MDLFSIIFNAFKPYMFGILKLALAMTFFGHALRLIRHKMGSGMNSGVTYGSLWTAFIGYLLGRGIPIIIGLIDQICDEILKNVPY